MTVRACLSSFDFSEPSQATVVPSDVSYLSSDQRARDPNADMSCQISVACSYSSHHPRT